MPHAIPLYPVILSGGDGTRLWPASRKALPKQFMPLGGTTLFKKTLERACALPGAATPLVLCNNEHRFLAAAQAQETLSDLASQHKPAMLLEPVGRNTAPAIALAALHLEKENPLLLVMPSDHDLRRPEDFFRAVETGRQSAEQGYLVTFGIVPASPETGYGYIQQGEPLDGEASVMRVGRFVEKPDAATARKFVDSGAYFWNSGMFLFRAAAYLEALSAYAPEIVAACREAYEKRTADLDFIRLDETAFAASPSDSIDYAVMERTTNACVVPLETDWSDLGSWKSLYSMETRDALGNVFSGDVVSCDSSNSYVLAQHRLVAALGLDGIIVVETPDVVMVAHKDHTQDVKKLVSMLRSAGRSETELHSRVYRPWGSYESLIVGDRFQVKRLIVTPGQQLSLQRHFHRAEHWVVVRGTAQVSVNGGDVLLGEDESTYIPIGGTHRLANPGKVPLEIIEIQTGSYLGEDDIERLEDRYGR